ncbi:hypothetical protein [Polynucleobacter sp. JS-Polo-80-F4]|uniref:hypothetical protein n=1 Tax=Polynucleobacter sp. JS-Polo-80-F4 TaxID=2576918 RepID=UPI001C0BA148|nr:hypothetical protein [Polynucleobacter sp. JS-Polo-80-F4]MBU3617261.1 hypothetical protein [Polynucleobacter sp. JS-Polo-80-F4]
MAKPIIVSMLGKDYSFAPTKVDRSKIYGSKKRVALDPQGRFCTRAALSSDGAHLVLTGMSAQGYFRTNGVMVGRQEMVGLDLNGKVVEPIPSTLGVSQALEGPVSGSEILGLDVESLYYLDPLESGSDLLTKLQAGEIYKFSINYTSGLELETAYLVSNDEGCFAIVGKPALLNWIESATLFESVEVSEDADDLDFESM